MVLLLDQARAVYGMDPIAPLDIPVTTADAWELLRFERGATLWLEGRRLWDLRRWDAEGGVVADPFSEGRDLCFPISDEEQRVNPNL
ncbi:MAG: RagB/SusD family nutrient uptake outer membrane protein, partial [Longimicrobiales bacterium]